MFAFWEDLKVSQLEYIDSCKAMFYKRVLGLHKSCRNRLVYLICNQPLIVETLMKRNNAPISQHCNDYLKYTEGKLCDVDLEFFSTPVMLQKKWKEANNPKRHLVVRASVHGFSF